MIAYLTTIKDEEDIIFYNLCYYRQIGIRSFYIIDNGSTDNTLLEIEKFKKKYNDCFIHLEVDREVGYWQYLRINKLANLAYSQGHKWMMPIDADELLFQDGNPNFKIYTWLKSFEKNKGDYIKYYWWFYRMNSLDSKDPNPIYRIVNRDLQPLFEHSKIMVRWKPGMEISQGNHMLHYSEKYNEIQYKDKVYLAHYSYRSKQHIKKKVENLGEAYQVIQNKLKHEQWISEYKKFKKNPNKYTKELIEREYATPTILNCQIVQTLQKALLKNIKEVT